MLDREERAADEEHREASAERTDAEQHLASGAVDEHARERGAAEHDGLEHGVGPVGVRAVKPARLEDLHRVAEHERQSAQLVARNDDEDDHERNHEAAVDEHLEGREDGIAGRLRRGFLRTALFPVGRLRRKESAQEEQHRRHDRNPDERLPGGRLRGDRHVRRVACAEPVGHGQADDAREDDAADEEELEEPRALAAVLRRQRLREIERRDRADKAHRDALERKARHEQRITAVAPDDDRRRQDEQQRREDEHPLAAEHLGKRTRGEAEDRRDDARGGDERSHPRGADAHRRLEVRHGDGENVAARESVEDACQS